VHHSIKILSSPPDPQLHYFGVPALYSSLGQNYFAGNLCILSIVWHFTESLRKLSITPQYISESKSIASSKIHPIHTARMPLLTAQQLYWNGCFGIGHSDVDCHENDPDLHCYFLKKTSTLSQSLRGNVLEGFIVALQHAFGVVLLIPLYPFLGPAVATLARLTAMLLSSDPEWRKWQKFAEECSQS